MDKSGAWMVYDYNYGPYVIALHATCEESARFAARQGYGKVGFWPFGMELGEAVQEWEKN